MRRTLLTALVFIFLLVSTSVMLVFSDADPRLDEGTFNVESVTSRLNTPSQLGPPADLIMEQEGKEMLVPFFRYAGSNFVLARYSGNGSAPDLLLTSSSADRVLIEEMITTTSLISGSSGTDVLLRDLSGNIYGIEVHDNWTETRSLGDGDMILSGMFGEISVGDINGDGHQDILHLVANGTQVEILEGPFPSSGGKAVLSLPDRMERITCGMDLTGDGISEMVMWVNNGNMTRLFIYHGNTLSPMALLGNDHEIGSISSGDLDGDLTDDLFLLQRGPYPGKISVLRGSRIGFDTDIGEDAFEIYGKADQVISGNETMMVTDLDGDQISDLILGDPDHDGGRGRILIDNAPGAIVTGSEERIPLGPENEITGEMTSDRLGSGIYTVRDLDGDLLPDIVLTRDGNLERIDFDPNPSIDSVENIRFRRDGIERSWTEIGSVMEITCIGYGCDSNITEVLLANLTVDDTDIQSWVYLRETMPDSCEFSGRVLMSGVNLPGRSVGVNLFDTVSAEVMGVKSSPIDLLGVTGRDDVPVFGEEKYGAHIKEGDPLMLQFTAKDPEGETLNWTVEDLPEWLSIGDQNGERGSGYLSLLGEPGDPDVGWNNFTVVASSGPSNSSRYVSVLVENRVPDLGEIDATQTAVEGVPYELNTDAAVVEGISGSSLNVSGPVEDPWLELLPNGTVFGTPGNRHVGLWKMNLTVYDENGANHSREWTVNVTNVAPEIISPITDVWRESERLVLDFDSVGEGDGFTRYELTFSTIDVNFDNTTGIAVIPNGSFITQDTMQVGVLVDDGHGEVSRGGLSMEVINLRPMIRNFEDIPEEFRAGEIYRFPLLLNHPHRIDGFGNMYNPGDVSVFTEDDVSFLQISAESIILNPWNMDSGDHTVRVKVADWEGVGSTYVWDIEVITNGSFRDPELDIEILGKRDDELYLGIVHSSPVDATDLRIFVKEFNSDEFRQVGSKEPENEDPFRIDISDMSVNIDVRVDMYLSLGRVISETVNVRTDILEDPYPDDDGPGIIWIMVPLLLIISLVTAAVLVERTSFALRMALFRGGEIREEEVVRAIQDRPGLSLKQLGRSADVGVADLSATIDHLERRGRVRATYDGLKVRFWPMMGSFVDGPLVLNRYQKRILDVMLDGGRYSVRQLRDEAGISARRVEKEISMLDLKNAVSKKRTAEGDIFYLTGRQRARLRRSF